MKKAAFSRGGLPKIFMDRFGQHVTGFISGLDRLRFRATLRPLFQPGGLEIYLYSGKALLKDFGKFAKELTDVLFGSKTVLKRSDFWINNCTATGPVCWMAC